MALGPKSVLDVGIGFGKWGYLLREYLDIWHGRLKSPDWEAQIDGVEAFPDYVTYIHRSIYDRIYTEPIENVIDQLNNYDLILMPEVIEHFDEEIGREVLIKCWQKCRAIIITTPTYDAPQGELHGNPYEEHKSFWDHEKLAEATGKGDHAVIQGRYLVFWARKG